MEYEQRKKCAQTKRFATFHLYIHPYGHAQVMAGTSCNQQGINQLSVEKLILYCTFDYFDHLLSGGRDSTSLHNANRCIRITTSFST